MARDLLIVDVDLLLEIEGPADAARTAAEERRRSGISDEEHEARVARDVARSIAARLEPVPTTRTALPWLRLRLDVGALPHRFWWPGLTWDALEVRA